MSFFKPQIRPPKRTMRYGNQIRDPKQYFEQINKRVDELTPKLSVKKVLRENEENQLLLPLEG